MTSRGSRPDAAARTEIADAATAARYIGEHCLTDGTVGRVGLEIEAHCFDPADPHRRPGWDEIGEVLVNLPSLPGGSAVTVEPGGAVELSSPPLDDVRAAITATAADRAVLQAAFADVGLGLVLLGADPLRPARRINPGARYQAMERFFIASHTPTAGAAMMTSTASIQVNLDAGPVNGWAGRVWLAHALGPTMVAIAANSPMLGGRCSGWESSRQRVWSQLDSARCGPILGADGSDPAADWARYALKAPVMLVQTAGTGTGGNDTNGTGDAVPVTDYVPFADWADGRVLLGDRRPTVADLDYHLTTLFPPVRPRGWLEIRYLDSVGDRLWPAIVFTLVTLLDDPAAAGLAAEAVAPVATAWDVAARVGLADRDLRTAAVGCLRIAAERIPASDRELAAAMDRLLGLAEQGRCPADEFADRVFDGGVEPVVAQLAKGEP